MAQGMRLLLASAKSCMARTARLRRGAQAGLALGSLAGVVVAGLRWPGSA